MGYQIEYAMDKVHVVRKNAKSELLTGIIFVVMLVIGTVGVQLCSIFIQKLFFEHGGHVMAATEQLVEDLRSDVEVIDAVQAFYTELAK